MSTYRPAASTSISSVAAAVTFAVSAWLAVAGGAMVLDRPDPQGAVAESSAPAGHAVSAVAIAPEARETIVVMGRRA